MELPIPSHLEECVSNGDSFLPKDWVDEFEWISVATSCCECGFGEEEWASFETM